MKKNGVVFAECDSDFLDILFSFFTVPLGTFVSLLRSRYGTSNSISTFGCLGNVYASIYQMDPQNFCYQVRKDILLRPRSAALSLCNKLKITIDCISKVSYPMCSCVTTHKLFNYYEGYCKCDEREISHTMYTNNKDGVFLQGFQSFLITDNFTSDSCFC